MQGLTLFNLNLTHLLDAFLETAVPMIAGLAEVVGLFIIITSPDHRAGISDVGRDRQDLFAAESGVRGAAGGHLCAARFDEYAAALGDGGRPPPGQRQGKGQVRLSEGRQKRLTGKRFAKL